MTTITDPAAPRFQAILLKSHLRLMLAGLKHSNLSGKDILSKVSAITGQSYKRAQYAIALADLNTYLEETTNG